MIRRFPRTSRRIKLFAYLKRSTYFFMLSSPFLIDLAHKLVGKLPLHDKLLSFLF
jgi:hypothetical protein